MSTHETINHMLVHLFNEIWKIEEEAIITGEFQNMTSNDMHIIEAIGLGDGKNMSTIAKKLDITVGSLTTAMNGLVNKQYVVRERSEQDRRVVYIQLTDKGIRALHHHAEFHKQMTDAVVNRLETAELDVLVKTLDELSHFFQGVKDGENQEEGGLHGETRRDQK